EKDEMALRAVSAPAIGRFWSENAEVAVATGKYVVVTIVAREARGNGEFRQRTQQGVIIQVGGDPRMNQGTKTLFEIPALAPLVIDRHAVVLERGAGCGTLVGKYARVMPVEDRCDHENRRIDRRYRNVPVEGAGAVVVEKHGGNRARDVEHGQAAALRTGFDQSRTADPRRPGVLARRLEDFHADQRIL